MRVEREFGAWMERTGTRLETMASEYRGAVPFPHVMIDDFLDPDLAEEASAAFPIADDEIWIHYSHYNSDKHGLTKIDVIPEPMRSILVTLNSPRFLRHLERLTGINGLLADPDLEGGGLHQSQVGGYLNVHADFTVHPIRRDLRRRVNLLVYLNDDWKDEYEGHLELWSRDMKTCHARISPLLNRCVIFDTDVDSYHGVPEPLRCPPDRTRNSMALYYYTFDESARLRPTNYRARPTDGSRRALIWLDKTAIGLYTRVKRRLNIPDEVVGRIVAKFRRKK
ncbi:MAG: 2OG-Fe(II) oxygenase [Actinomycetota bacterium]